MKIQGYKFINKSYLFLIFTIFVSCTPLISKFDYIAYENTISLKVDALHLMSKATNPYQQYETKVEQLKLDLKKVYEYSKQIPLNEITAQQWELMKNPGNNLLGGFLKRWEEKGMIPPFMVDEAIKLVSKSFDDIIELETNKIK